MAKYKKESHLRSLLKSISWRVVATTDTILVVLLITSLEGTYSVENALRIGGVELVIKFLIYYVHERIWQFAYKDGVVRTKETLFKTISWRVVATSMTFLISGAVLKSFDEVAFYIAITELFTKFILYYFHERLWLKLPLGKIRDYFKRLLKISNE